MANWIDPVAAQDAGDKMARCREQGVARFFIQRTWNSMVTSSFVAILATISLDYHGGCSRYPSWAYSSSLPRSPRPQLQRLAFGRP